MKCSLLVLSSYLDGELEARREGELEAHLVGCQRCRAGLGYLREEVERVSALGRVHVADHSIHALLTQLGLIEADEELPSLPAAVALAEPPPGPMPAWMGGDDAPSVPWDMGSGAHAFEDSVDMTGTPSRGSLPTMESEGGAEGEEPADEFPTELAAEFAAAAAAEFPPAEVSDAAEFPAAAAAEAPEPPAAAELAAEFAAAASAEFPPAAVSDPRGGEVPLADEPAEPQARRAAAELAAEFPPAAADTPEPPAAAPEPSDPPTFRWVADPHTPAAASPQPSSATPDPRPPFTWAPPPQGAPAHAGPPAAPEEDGVPAVPFAYDPSGAAPEPAPAPQPPASTLHGPPGTTPETPDAAPPAPLSAGAFPPGGPERVEPSDSLTDDPAPGGEPEMTASPPWAPHEAPAGPPLYPMTDDDVLGEPVPVERFGPPPQAARPSFFERLRDRIAVRRALARSSSAYEDQVQIVSGLGAPLRPGRARAEVERRRQETLRMDPGGIPGHAVAPFPAHAAHDAHDEPELDDDLPADVDLALDPDADPTLGLGPLPPLRAPLHDPTPMPRPATPAATTPPPLPPRTPPPSPLPGQMPLPGTSVEDPFSPTSTDPRAPIHRTPMPPPRHSIGSVLGEISPPRPPLPPAMPPASPPKPDPLGEALAGFDRDHGTVYEPRPWRPRELAEDVQAPPHRHAAPPPDTAERPRRSPSQLRDGRRLLAVFGAATLVMFVVGVVSGRTTSPTPTSTTTAPPRASAPATVKPKTSAPAAQSSAPAQSRPQPSVAPSAAAPQLTSVKVLGDSGTGYQVKDFRYGIHPNDFRIVLDLDSAGTASGTPRATVGFLDPTTLYVVLDGVVPAGSTGQLPSSNPATSVSLVQPSPFNGATTYQIKLAHPVQFTAVYASSPLRLVIDLAG